MDGNYDDLMSTFSNLIRNGFVTAETNEQNQP